MRKIELIDTTFRDGQQSPLMFDSNKYKFNLEEKKVLIRGLIKLGIRYIEFFSPIVNDTEKQDFIAIKKYVLEELRVSNVTFIAHCRVHKDDIKVALQTGFNGLNLYIGTSKQSIKYKHGKQISDIKKIASEIIKEVRKNNKNIYLRFSGEDAFRTNIKDLIKVYDSVCNYVDTFGIPDTVGCATPSNVEIVVTKMKNRYKNNLETHFHNDRGYSFINTITAVESGANFIDTSIWGMAERSGINSTTGTLLNLYLQDKNLVKGYNLENCYPLNVLMASILNMHVPYNEPVSLTNRTHIAGVHTGAVLKNSSSYEATDLEKFGVTSRALLLGPLSGWNVVYYYLKEVLYYKCSEEEAKQVTVKFKNESTNSNRYNTPKEILEKVANKFGLKRYEEKVEGVKRVENLE